MAETIRDAFGPTRAEKDRAGQTRHGEELNDGEGRTGSGGVAPAQDDKPMTASNHRWTVLGIAVAAQASFAAAFSGIPVTGPTLRHDYHLTTGQLGLALGMISLGIAVTEIAWGVATDRFGERRILLGGLVSTGAMLTVMALLMAPDSGAAALFFFVLL